MDWHNYYYRISSANRTLRTVLAFVGLLLLSFGVLILLVPWLLRFLVGAGFILAGVAILAMAWRRRSAPRRPPEPGSETDVIDEWR